MTDELLRRAEQAEAIALTLHARLDQAEADAAAMRILCQRQLDPTRTIRDRHMELIAALQQEYPGAAILAVAEAARAYVQAGEYDDLADLLIALKGAVDRWGR